MLDIFISLKTVQRNVSRKSWCGSLHQYLLFCKVAFIFYFSFQPFCEKPSMVILAPSSGFAASWALGHGPCVVGYLRSLLAGIPRMAFRETVNCVALLMTVLGWPRSPLFKFPAGFIICLFTWPKSFQVLIYSSYFGFSFPNQDPRFQIRNSESRFGSRFQLQLNCFSQT